jgi:hypothetical protein
LFEAGCTDNFDYFECSFLSYQLLALFNTVKLICQPSFNGNLTLVARIFPSTVLKDIESASQVARLKARLPNDLRAAMTCRF